MAATSIPHRWKYDVFVSFRGEDIRKNFMDHMFNDFNQKGIHAFRDDNELPKGEEISPHLYNAIEESRFLIVIFSKNYASSSWCLRELVKILECKQMGKPKHEVQTIFYDVKPDLVRKQTGSYAEAFAKHDVSNRIEVDKWKEALSMVANLSGWDLQDIANGQGMIQPQRSVSFEGSHMLKKLNLSYCDLEQVPESIGGLSCLKELYLNGNNLLEVPESIVGLSRLQLLYLEGNNFTSLPGNLSQLSHLRDLCVDGCKKLEVLPKLPPSLRVINASDCTSLREVAESYKDPIRYNVFINCPKLLKNVTIDSEGSISKTQFLDSTITSQGFIHQLSAIIGYFGFPTNRCEFFLQDTGFYSLNIVYPGNSIREWFTNRSKGKHVKVQLPSDWCYNKFRGFGTCVVFKRKKPRKLRGYSLKNFDGASLNPIIYSPFAIRDYFENEVIGIQDSYLIWLHYTKKWEDWKEAKNFVTFCFEAIEVKECGVRLICDEDLQQQEDVTNLMFQDLPTLSQHGGAISYYGPFGEIHWSC